MGTTKTRVLVDQELIDKHGAVITAEDVMRITGITSKTTALKRMDSETDQQVLSRKELEWVTHIVRPIKKTNLIISLNILATKLDVTSILKQLDLIMIHGSEWH